MFEQTVSTNISSSIWASMNSWFTPTVLFVLLNLMIGTIAFTSTLSNQKQQHRTTNNNNHHQQHHQHHQQMARSPSVLQRLRSINFYNFRSHDTHTSIFKSTPDSDTLYNLDQTHQPQIHDSQSHYVFDQTRQESSNLGAQTTHYIFQQENHQQIDTHHVFEQENPTQIVSDHRIEEKIDEFDVHFDYDIKKASVSMVEEETEELQSMDEIYSRLKGRQVNRSASDTKPTAGEIPAKLPAKMKKSASMKSAFKHFELIEDDVEPRRPVTMRERPPPVAAPVHEVDAKADDFINRFKQQLKLQRLDSILRYKEMIGRGARQ